MCVCVYVCVCVYLCVYLCMCECAYVYVYVCERVHYVCMRVFLGKGDEGSDECRLDNDVYEELVSGCGRRRRG